MDHGVYDVIVVGAGMIGSAAARYASERRDLKVCVIGPDEPETAEAFDSRDIYGAHYDEARITNSTQSHPIWAKLASRSMGQYRSIEKLSGIDFYEEVGSALIGRRDGCVLDNLQKAATEAGHQTELLNHVQSMQKFPYLKINEDEKLLYQKVAGYVNPRKLISAELLLAKRNNCDIVRDIVSRIHYPTIDSEPLKLQTDLGNTFFARRVLLCPGAFIEMRKLLPQKVTPDWKLLTQSVIYAQVSQKDLLLMRDMPCIGKKCEGLDSAHNDCYILPPVKYPDGEYYIKLGHGAQFDKSISVSQIKDWYCQEVPSFIRNSLVEILQDLFPDFHPVIIKSDTCITTRTEDKSLYVDLLTPQVAVAIAGNGYAAKACDYVGKLAADLIITSDWNCDLPRDWFRFKNKTSKL